MLASGRGCARLFGKRCMRRRGMSFFFQRRQCRARPLGGRAFRRAATCLGRIARSLFTRALRSGPALRRRQFHPRAPRLREPDGDRLLRRPGAMFAFANMVHLLANELSGLRAGSLSFTRVLSRSIDGSFFRHDAHSRAIAGPACPFNQIAAETEPHNARTLLSDNV
jgi:hypothetical protein